MKIANLAIGKRILNLEL